MLKRRPDPAPKNGAKTELDPVAVHGALHDLSVQIERVQSVTRGRLDRLEPAHATTRGRLDDLVDAVTDLAATVASDVVRLERRLDALEANTPTEPLVDAWKAAQASQKARRDSQGRPMVPYQTQTRQPDGLVYRVQTMRTDPTTGDRVSFHVGTWKGDGERAFGDSRTAAQVLASALQFWPTVNADQIVAAVKAEAELGADAVDMLRAYVDEDLPF